MKDYVKAKIVEIKEEGIVVVELSDGRKLEVYEDVLIKCTEK